MGEDTVYIPCLRIETWGTRGDVSEDCLEMTQKAYSRARPDCIGCEDEANQCSFATGFPTA